jgi:Domain of unknown function (DUF222)
VLWSRVEDMFEVVEVDNMAPGPELAQVLLSAEPSGLDEVQATCWLRASERLLAYVEAQRYTQLAHYADLHAPDEESDDENSDLPGRERSIRPGGAGTPAVREFAVTDLAVGIHCTSGRADGLLGDALDLRHRMPALFARLSAGEVPAYKVRMVLRAATGASELAARRLDTAVAPVADKIGPKRLEKLVTRVLLEVDPGEADRRAKAAAEHRRVTVVSDQDGDRRVFAHVDPFTGASFDAAVQHVATMLGNLGDTRCLDARRADALGWLANPLALLALSRRHGQLLSGREPLPWPTTSNVQTTTDLDGDDGLRPGLWLTDMPTPHDLVDPSLWPTTTLVVHIDHAAWQRWQAMSGGEGVADLKGHGPITLDQAFDHLRHSNVTIKPVVDLDDDLAWATDTGLFTGLLREAVGLANPWNPFPYSDAETRETDDIDHTLARSAGGKTRLDNGGPLRRRLHRHKTFAKGWRVRQPFAGIFLWRSPEGRIYLHDRRGLTHDLGYGDIG